MVDIRNICSDDYETLGELEAAIFGRAGYPLVGSYYLRVCTELYAETCFLALINGKPVGYILTFINESTAYSTRLGVREEFHGTSAAMKMIGALCDALVEKDCNLCWFTVKPDNLDARRLYRKIGAIERNTRQSFFVPGDELIFQEMDRATIQRNSERFGGKRYSVQPLKTYQTC